jgi:hypothetical protein
MRSAWHVAGIGEFRNECTFVDKLRKNTTQKACGIGPILTVILKWILKK